VTGSGHGVKSVGSGRVTGQTFRPGSISAVTLTSVILVDCNFGTAAQETNYKLSGQPPVATKQNHLCLVGMK